MSLNFDPKVQSSNVRFELNAKNSPKSKNVEGADKEESSISSSSEAKAWISPNWFSNAATTVVNAVKWVFTSIWKLFSSLLCCSNPLRSLESFVKADAQKSAEQLAKDPVGHVQMLVEAAKKDRKSTIKIINENAENFGNIIAKLVPLRIESLSKELLDKYVKAFKKDENNHKDGKAVEPDEETLKAMKEKAEEHAKYQVEAALDSVNAKEIRDLKNLIVFVNQAQAQEVINYGLNGENVGPVINLLMFNGEKVQEALNRVFDAARETYAEDQLAKVKEESKKSEKR